MAWLGSSRQWEAEAVWLYQCLLVLATWGGGKLVLQQRMFFLIKDFDLKPSQSNLTLVVHKIMKMITSQFDCFLSLEGLLNLKLHEEG
jgi:hypothetical protein